MTTSEERLQILTMIEQGQISPEEGAKLLGALSSKSAPSPPAPPPQARWFRVRVTDLNTGRNKVSINIPTGLVDVGLRMGARFVPASAEVDLQEIADKIHSGQQGKIFESINEQDGEQIEIFLE